MRLLMFGVLWMFFSSTVHAQTAMALYYDGLSADVVDRHIKDWINHDKAIRRRLKCAALSTNAMNRRSPFTSRTPA